jgi:hypothetical protein
MSRNFFVWTYTPRNGGKTRVFRNYADARAWQEKDNVFTLEDLLEMDPDTTWAGSEELGFFFIEDGGSLERVRLE